MSRSYADNIQDKRYDEVTFLTTHNSYNYAWKKNRISGPKFYLFPNQNYPIGQQLKKGVRAFMLDLHYYKGALRRHRGKVVLCHGGKGCDFLGFEPASNVFSEMNAFLRENPDEIITMILESYVSVKDIERLLKQSHLFDFLHIQDPKKEWPKISNMINNNKRLVVFNDQHSEDDPAWNHDLFGAFAVETHYSFRSIKKFDCELNRGSRLHKLFILNHFVTRISGSRVAARRANRKKTLLKRVHDCFKQHQLIPNFLTVDFVKYGESLEVVRYLNKIKETND